MTQDRTEDYSAWSDMQCVNAIIQARTRRTTLDMPRVLVVRRINQAGYAIGMSEYSGMENAPARYIDHVRKGILPALNQALDLSVPLPGESDSERLTRLLFHYRLQSNDSYESVAAAVTNRGYPITRDQYRAIEQGLTRKIPFDVAIGAATYLGIPAHELIPSLQCDHEMG